MPAWTRFFTRPHLQRQCLIISFFPLQLINLMALILPWLELILGVLLLSGIWLSGAVLGINFLMIIFIGALDHQHGQGP